MRKLLKPRLDFTRIYAIIVLRNRLQADIHGDIEIHLGRFQGGFARKRA